MLDYSLSTFGYRGAFLRGLTRLVTSMAKL